MARDWRAPASFRGVNFFVDRDSLPQGRKKVVHEYPNSETWDLEDLGAKAGKFSVTCYFCSETSDSDIANFIQVLNLPSSGPLILPVFGVLLAQAEDWSPSWTNDKLNYVGVEVTFLQDSSAGAPVPVGLGERILAGQGASLGTTLGNVISGLFAGI